MQTLKSNFFVFIFLLGSEFVFSQNAEESKKDGIQSRTDSNFFNQSTIGQHDAFNSNVNNTGNDADNGRWKANCAGNGGGSGKVSLLHCISALPAEPLSSYEIDALKMMREEELLACDVYVLLYAKYTIPVFNNISQSEKQHAEAVKTLLLKYNLPDPALNHVPGVFSNPDLQALYNSLAAQGSVSLAAGLAVGATIEDRDIADLHNYTASGVDNLDIEFVFGNLEKGSRNHLRSFHRLLTARGLTYSPKFISSEYLNQVISTPHETGPVDCLN